MANAKPIRCDEWRLLADVQTSRMAADTVAVYRCLANALASVFLTHWPEVHDLPVQDLESFFHDTKKTKDTPYGGWFRQHFHKVPAYLRRSATMAAHGAVSSYMTRYRAWQGGDRRMRAQRPPRWGGVGAWPTLYAANGGAGAMIRHEGDTLHLKLLDRASGDWLWRKVVVVRRGQRHGRAEAVPLSPSLVVRGAALCLAQPYELSRQKRDKNPVERVAAVDLGINKQATCSIVSSDGTVTARKFIHLAAHIDRQDKTLCAIQDKARQTAGQGGSLTRGFCRTLYRRAVGLNTHIAQEISRQALAFAAAHEAKVVVFENLKHFRPSGGRPQSRLRRKFHTWLHRATVRQAEQSAEERGMRVALVPPRGTSSWAYDGSGRVVRSKANYGRCRFRSGKEYDCDLSASYNIAARWFVREKNRAERKRAAVSAAGNACCAQESSPAGGKTGWPMRGRRSGVDKTPSTVGPRTPVTLSSLWVTPQQAAA